MGFRVWGASCLKLFYLFFVSVNCSNELMRESQSINSLEERIPNLSYQIFPNLCAGIYYSRRGGG